MHGIVLHCVRRGLRLHLFYLRPLPCASFADVEASRLEKRQVRRHLNTRAPLDSLKRCMGDQM